MKILGGNGDECIDVMCAPVGMKATEFEVTADLEKFWTEASKEVVMNSFVGDGHVVLFEIAFDL